MQFAVDGTLLAIIESLVGRRLADFEQKKVAEQGFLRSFVVGGVYLKCLF